jgi:hypothetical protein
MGCNGWNHYPSCNCGWGGDTSEYQTSYPFSGYVNLGDLAGDPITVPTTCWWCGAAVFFHRAYAGGCVLFDELGPPWPVHACWEQHRSERFMMEIRTRSSLTAVGWTGDDSRAHLRYPVRIGQEGEREHLHGYILCTYSIDPLASSSLAGTAHAWIADVVDSNSRKLRVLLPPVNVDAMSSFDLVEVTGRWMTVRGKAVLAAAELSVIRDGKTIVRFGYATGATPCGLCGAPTEAEADWRISDSGDVECPLCRRMRGDLSTSAFQEHCRRVAATRS